MCWSYAGDKSGMKGNIRRLMLLAVTLCGSIVSGSAIAEMDEGRVCHAEAQEQTVYSTAPGGIGVVSFEVTGDGEFPLAMYLRGPAEDCARELVDRFAYAGGEPRIEDAVVLPFMDRDQLFVIASWPVNHRGVGTQGTYYQIRGYRADRSGVLEANEVLGS